jgi:hypothetical protein
VEFAWEQYKKLKAGSEARDAVPGSMSVARLFAAYEREHTPTKTPGQQKQDERRMEMWSRYLGADTDPHEIGRREWEAFIEDRGSGAIDSRGNPVPATEDRRTYEDPHTGETCTGVRVRSVEADLQWLNSVLRWGTTWPSAKNALLRFNPVKGLPAPREKNPVRPVATQNRFEAVREVSDDVRMEIRWRGKREYRRSYLSELLEIVNGTGRRIDAVVSLGEDDLRLDEGVHGKIRWRPDHDKEDTASVVPINESVRKAVIRARLRAGTGGYLFPCRDDPDEPISSELARSWLRKAEKAAGLEPRQRGGFHAYRRKWATERKHLPDANVAEAGGWRDVGSLRKAYQQPDDDTMLQVVSEPRELREVG